MQRLEVGGAVRTIYGSLGVKRSCMSFGLQTGQRVFMKFNFWGFASICRLVPWVKNVTW